MGQITDLYPRTKITYVRHLHYHTLIKDLRSTEGGTKENLLIGIPFDRRYSVPVIHRYLFRCSIPSYRRTVDEITSNGLPKGFTNVVECKGGRHLPQGSTIRFLQNRTQTSDK